MKFRAWDKTKCKMGAVYSINFNNSQATVKFNDPFFVEGGISLDKLIIMEYTGLRDSKGNGIYEGDIIEVDWHDTRYPVHNIVVTWNEESLTWNLEGGDPLLDAHYHYTVIGNIYEGYEIFKH